MSRRQSSIFSLGSLALAPKQDEFYYEDMTETELQQALESIAHSNLLLRLENDVFERHLARRDPESLQTITQLLETAKRVQKITPQHEPVSPVISATGSEVMNVHDKDATSVASIQSGSRHVTPSLLTVRAGRRGTKIPYAYRIEMVNTEIRELLKELVELEQRSTKKKVHLQAQLEENEISIRETRETREQFEENVILKGVDSITGKIPAEKFIRFIDEWLKTIDTMMERVRLKTTTVKSQMRRAKLRLKRREELGEALRVVDFEQLYIENRDYVRRIDEKNQHLLEVKKIAGRYGIALTRHKEKLGGLMSNVNEVRGKIVSRKQEIAKLQSEQAATKLEIGKAEKQLESLMALMDDFTVPEVIDFVKMRVELQKLQKIHKQLHRQRKIRQITFKSNRQLQNAPHLRNDTRRQPR